MFAHVRCPAPLHYHQVLLLVVEELDLNSMANATGSVDGRNVRHGSVSKAVLPEKRTMEYVERNRLHDGLCEFRR